ncbi:MAG: hypothetical protein PVJ84_22110 [Desulfobacteraceae bacterium]|jgi:hypothetical protein
MMAFISNQKDRARRLLESRWSPIAVAVVAILLVIGTLGTDIHFDDYIHRIKLRNPNMWPTGHNSIVGLFAFGSGNPDHMRLAMENSMVPWWTSEQLKVAFFRPVTAVTHWLDYQLWPDNHALMHFHSILWFGLFVSTAALVYRRFMTPYWVAGLAALLFAIDDAHGIPVGWLANRNALIAGVFGFLALIFHDRWRRGGHKEGAVFGPLAFLLGLLSAEAGLGVGAYLLSYELFLTSDKPRKKLMAFFPYVFVFVVWYAAYSSLGFGTTGSGAYIDPGRYPLAYLNALWERLPVLLYGQWLFPNAFVYGMLPKPFAYASLIVVYAVLIGIITVLIPILRRDAVSRFWALGMVLSLLPVCAMSPDNRLLIFCGLGAMGLLARLLAAWFVKAEWLPASKPWRVLAGCYVSIFIFVHFIVAPLFLPIQSLGVDRMEEVMLERPILDLYQEIDFNGKTLVFINPPLPFAVMHLRFICWEHGIAIPNTTRVLASGISSDLTIARVDSRSLEIEAQGGFITNTFDRLYRGRFDPMTQRQRIELSDMVAEVLSLTPDQRPLKVRFTFSRALENASLCFYQWKEKGYIPFDPPAIGDSVRIAKVNMPL